MGKSWFKILLLSVISAFVLSSVMQYHHHDCSHEEGSEEYSFCLFHLLGHDNPGCDDASHQDEAEDEDDCPLRISKASIAKHTSVEDEIHLNFVCIILDIFHQLLIDNDTDDIFVFRDVDIILPEIFHGNSLRGPPASSLC